MDAVKYLKEKARIFESIGKCIDISCTKCPFFLKTECVSHKAESVEIVEKWSKENPQKTILQDFLEKYPNAKTDSKGEPKTCCVNLGYKKYDECDLGNCNFCWNRPLEG